MQPMQPCLIIVTHYLFALKADVYDFALSFTWNICINVPTYVCQTFSLEMKYTTVAQRGQPRSTKRRQLNSQPGWLPSLLKVLVG